MLQNILKLATKYIDDYIHVLSGEILYLEIHLKYLFPLKNKNYVVIHLLFNKNIEIRYIVSIVPIF